MLYPPPPPPLPLHLQFFSIFSIWLFTVLTQLTLILFNCRNNATLMDLVYISKILVEKGPPCNFAALNFPLVIRAPNVSVVKVTPNPLARHLSALISSTLLPFFSLLVLSTILLTPLPSHSFLRGIGCCR